MAPNYPPSHHAWQPIPPRGWNSYDAFGSSVTETQVLENAALLRQQLGSNGFDLVTVDYCWSHPDPGPVANPDQGVDLSPSLAMDRFGRLLPAPERFPSATKGVGFKSLGDRLHADGQRFGLHMMRGVPRQAVRDGCPIQAAPGGATARDIARPDDRCTWLDQMVGIDLSNPAGQAYYDSVIALYAEWGVDYLKADDLTFREGQGYAEADIKAIRRAIDRTGRPIVLSLSPGPAPPERARHLSDHANTWRMSADFWDDWSKLKAMFALCERWSTQTEHPDIAGWPDADMIPIGPVSQCGPSGAPRRSRFSFDEFRTMMTLWSLFRSPLILGGDLRGLNEQDWSLLVDPAWVEVSELGRGPRPLYRDGDQWVWASERFRNDPRSEQRELYVAVFNLSDCRRASKIALAELFAPAWRVASIRQMSGPAVTSTTEHLRVNLPSHASALVSMSFIVGH
ncbi:MAG: alpha-galactosidase [Planctomycetota bacterium]